MHKEARCARRARSQREKWKSHGFASRRARARARQRSEIAATLQDDPPRDKFLVQATSLTAEVFASIQAKPHKEQSDDVSNIWTTVEKESMFTKKLITSFTSKPAATGSSPATIEPPDALALPSSPYRRPTRRRRSA